MASPVKKPKRSRASKELRQRQLILATIEAVSKHGLSDTKLSQVSQIAGLSQGIVNLHFKSKDLLFTETLKYLRDEYRAVWLEALANAPDDPAEKLAALAKADFARSVISRKKLAVWFAFWGEAKANQSYRRICRESDIDHAKSTVDLMTQLVNEGEYTEIDPATTSTGFMALADGLWLGLHVSPDRYTRKGSLAIILQYLAYCFPRHAHIFMEYA
ncbi:MAG: TetR family transcriptional regulator C-terminal domain-containing protein [Kordiimonadaceae bacterium]|nr:TetR family transcriptional regulator C-terminal domain-containing protein [Kordiimonadaceae bacterium]